jgi:hypothetical protein
MRPAETALREPSGRRVMSDARAPGVPVAGLSFAS